MLQEQFEALARIDAFAEGDLDHAVQIFSAGHALNGGGHGFVLADRLEVGPRAGNVAASQKQLSCLAGSVAEGGFVRLALLALQVNFFGFDQRESETVADLHDAHGEQIARTVLFARRADQVFEYSFRPTLAVGEFQQIEFVAHCPCRTHRSPRFMLDILQQFVPVCKA